jgi:hypothetical protein
VIIPLIEVGLKIIDKIFPDPEQKSRAQLELIKQQQAGEFKELETRFEAIKAEANSADKWTSRARPCFMYVFYAILLSLTILAPAIGVKYPEAMDSFFANVGKGFESVPEELWWTFTAGYLGYTTARSYEKKKGVANGR